MRTAVQVDAELLDRLMACSLAATPDEAVEAAIRDHLKRVAIEWLRARAGTAEIADVVDELRRVDRST
jgi:hypothetical protein